LVPTASQHQKLTVGAFMGLVLRREATSAVVMKVGKANFVIRT